MSGPAPAPGPAPSPKSRPTGPARVWNLTDPPTVTYVPVDRNGYAQSGPDSAIVIDNGSYNVRAGWSFDRNPRLCFPPQMARYRDRKQNRMLTLVGNDAYFDTTSRSQARSVFESGSNVVYNWDVMENVLDYTFIKLGIEADRSGGIGRPVVMTEPMANPAYPRKTMSEILFECYGATSVAYGIDSLFSYRHNGGRTGIVASSSHSTTHVIPVIDSKPIFEQAARLNWGRSQSIEYLTKLLRLKYPNFPGKLTDLQVNDIIRQHCYVSADYPTEVARYLDWTGLEDRDRVIQHPYVEPVVVQKTEAELAAMAAKRKESGRRLQEQSAKMRLEKLMKKEKDLEFFKAVQDELRNATTKKEAKRILESNNFEHEGELDRAIKELERSLKRSRTKDVGDGEDDDDGQTFPLLDVPDEQLDEEGVKQKKQQRLQKAGYDARQRAKAEKAREAERIAELERLDAHKRETDIHAWIEEKREARQAVLARIKERDQAKAELGNRKSATNQMRMRTLASLAFDAPVKKRRRGGGDDDSFGADDADWDVYRSGRTRGRAGGPGGAGAGAGAPNGGGSGAAGGGIGGVGAGAGAGAGVGVGVGVGAAGVVGAGGGGGGGGTGSDDEDDDDLDSQLEKLESDLLAHDPAFTSEYRHEAETTWTRSLMHVFLHGPYTHDADSVREQNQMHLNVERIRVPEVLFQPTIAGVDQAGFGEIVAMVLNERFAGHDRRDDLVRDIFLTGGNAGGDVRGVYDRVMREVRACLPTGAPLKVRVARDVELDGWRGAAAWAEEERRKGKTANGFVTREEYLEKGGEYIKEHDCGNIY